ncbi:MAG: T9SS type A sorting domain-containing protein [Saprospiraceae bacterium]
MKKQLLKSLYAFIIMMLSLSITNAQIVYTDVNPDVAVTCTVSTPNSSCSAMDSIDINNDGVFDLKLSVSGSSFGTRYGSTVSGFVKATPLNGSAIISNTLGYPLHLYRNDSIKSNSHWSTAPNRILESVSHAPKQIGNTVEGNWTPPIDGFLGIKIVSGGQTNYGWIRLNVTINAPTASCMYKEFAYNSIPNQPIRAGQISNPIVIGPIVNIPDPAFKSTLVNNAAINTDIDREIQVTEATAFTGELFIYGAFISNLTGLEAFTAIDSLYLYGTGVTSLDVTSNTALIYLNCSYNKLTSIDVSGNTALTELYCEYNQLTSVDLSANTALTTLNCTHNQLTNLNVSTNTALTAMYCYYNQLTSLDVSSNMDLSILYTGNNPLTSLNFSNNLEFLDCEYNQLTSLDVSANTALWYLVCNNNQLTSLNVKNGNNIHFFAFDATFNPNLTCIQVDNVAYSNANWRANKDANASFRTLCGTTSVPDNGNLATVQIFPNPAVNHLNIDLGSHNQKVQITILDITGKVIYTTRAADTQEIEVDTKDFAEGIYVVQIQSGDFIGTKKLVVEK